MRKVFVSYSHNDHDFADKLVADLCLSDIAATYDKWILNIGDSIIVRLAEEVSDADSVVALLSPRSVESTWVRKELALAMTGEIASGSVKVLPALIEDCALPDMLSDKFYADFRGDYYEGLRVLLRALQPEKRGNDPRIAARLQRHSEIEEGARDFTSLLETGNGEAVRDWLRGNTWAFAGLFGRLWQVFEMIPNMPVGADVIDLAVVNGQSGRYNISLVSLGALNLENLETVQQAVLRQDEALRWCRENEGSFRRTLAVRMTSAYGVRQIRYSAVARSHLAFDSKIIMGRRAEYGASENDRRNQIYEGSHRGIDLISYDRIAEGLGYLTAGL